jgi:hypothetical protein
VKLFGALLFQKHWVATKRCIGRELNRERIDYYDRKAVSTGHFGDHSPEPRESNYATWNHNLTASATTWIGPEEARQDFAPLPPAVARFRGCLEDDPVVKQMASGAFARPSAYVVKSAIRVTRPGLALVLADSRSQSGIPELPGDRSVLFISPRAEPGPSVGRVRCIDAGLSLITRPLGESISVVGNIARLLGGGGTIRGLAFKAEAAREALRSGARLLAGYVPAAFRETAAELAESGEAAHAKLEAFLNGLWTDENLVRLAEQMRYGLAAGEPGEADYLAEFTLNVPAARPSTCSHELASA